MRYCKNINGKWEKVATHKLPKKVYDSDLDDHIDLVDEATFNKYGYFQLEGVSYNPKSHKLSDELEKVGTKIRHKLTALNPTLFDLKNGLLMELKGYRRTAYTEAKHAFDYYKDTGRASELNNLKTKIGEFYQLHETERAKIEALTTIDDAANYTLPMDDINKGLQYLRDLI